MCTCNTGEKILGAFYTPFKKSLVCFNAVYKLNIKYYFWKKAEAIKFKQYLIYPSPFPISQCCDTLKTLLFINVTQGVGGTKVFQDFFPGLWFVSMVRQTCQLVRFSRISYGN